MTKNKMITSTFGTKNVKIFSEGINSLPVLEIVRKVVELKKETVKTLCSFFSTSNFHFASP